MSTEKKWVTASDVARLAGVSRSAVSRAFTPGASVAPETRRRVEEAARELGYQVNILARSMNKGRSNFVGLVTAGFGNAFRNQLIGPLTHQLARQGLIPLLVNAEDSYQQAPGLRDLMSYHVAGIIMTSGAPPLSLAQEYVARSIPVVIINRDTDLPGTDVVYSDNVDGARQAARWLQQRGCQRPAFIGEQPANFSTRQRRDAFCLALTNATCIDVNGSDYHAGFNAVAQLQTYSDIDGVFCATDTLALGLRDALSQHPSLSSLPLVGFDDIPEAGYAARQLTTLRQDVDRLAGEAVSLLIQRMEDDQRPPVKKVVPVQLIARR
jgi:DNA-binding LacI/PurR family transcriptional regulator